MPGILRKHRKGKKLYKSSTKYSSNHEHLVKARTCFAEVTCRMVSVFTNQKALKLKVGNRIVHSMSQPHIHVHVALEEKT